MPRSRCKCLSLGALDYLPKPATNREVTTSLGFRQELIAKVEGARPPAPRRRPSARRPPRAVAPPPRRAPGARRSRRAASSSAPRPAVRVRSPRSSPASTARCGRCRCSSCSTCRRSSRRCSPSTSRASSGFRPARRKDGEAPVAGQIYVAPGGRHIGLVRDKLHKVVLRVDDGAGGEFLPAGGRHPVPRRRRGLRGLGARGGADRHGLGRARRRESARRGRRRRHRPGRGDEHGLGHARPCRPRRLRRGDPAARGHRGLDRQRLGAGR